MSLPAVAKLSSTKPAGSKVRHLGLFGYSRSPISGIGLCLVTPVGFGTSRIARLRSIHGCSRNQGLPLDWITRMMPIHDKKADFQPVTYPPI